MDERISFTIRPFGLEEAAAVTAISADVGWNQPEEEIRHIIRRSGKYLLGAFHGDALVGVAASYPYPDGGFAYVNEVIVSSAWRKRGAATQLLEELLPLTSADYPVLRLCATALGRPIYEKFGFKPFATVSFGEETGELAAPEASGFAPFTAADLAEAVELDAANFGARRPEVLEKLLDAAPNAAWTLRRGGKLAGFIIRSSMNWFLQAVDGSALKALVSYADTRPSGRMPVLIRSEHVELLGAPINEHFKLTLMQYGDAIPFPPAAFSGFLPDIG
jgi:GNAT superfamily N-acetyltransferase